MDALNERCRRDRHMTFGAAPPQPRRDPPHPERLRTLWRVERRKDFRCQIITAAIYRHPVPNTCELRVFIEPEADNNLLHPESREFAGGVLELGSDGGDLDADHLPTAQTLARLRDDLRAGLDALWDGAEWELTLTPWTTLK